MVTHQQSNNIGEFVVLSRQLIDHQGFPQQITEHQRADERERGNEAATIVTTIGKQILNLFYGEIVIRIHANQTFFSAGHQSNDRRLNDGHQRYVRIGSNRNRPRYFCANRFAHN